MKSSLKLAKFLKTLSEMGHPGPTAHDPRSRHGPDAADRPHQEALTLPDAVEELERCAGSQLDPEVVEVLLEAPPSLRDDRDAGFLALSSGAGPSESVALVNLTAVPLPDYFLERSSAQCMRG